MKYNNIFISDYLSETKFNLIQAGLHSKLLKHFSYMNLIVNLEKF